VVVGLVMLSTICALFILWRRANSLRSIVSHQLKSWSEPTGQIRLSEDDGPPAREFLEDDEGVAGDDPRRIGERVVELKPSNTTQQS